jgi:cell division protein FtsW
MWTIGIVLLLVVIGLVAVYSASFAQALVETGTPQYFFTRQVVWTALGLVVMFGLMRIPYSIFRPLSPILMVFALGALIAVLIPGIGIENNGARRWLGISNTLSGQPSEFAKLVIIIYVSAWLAAKGRSIQSFLLGFVPFVLMVGTVCALIVKEPDLGTAIVVLLTTMTLFFVAGASLTHVITVTLIGAVAVSVLVFTGGYRMDRIVAFANAESDPSGVGFHTLQLLIAFGSGGLTGLGLGDSRQKFFYVPGAHTDGVFAIIGEEIGFIGAISVLLLYMLLIYRGFQIARYARDDFGSYMAVGIICWIGYQTMINIGGVTRSIPLTGIPLPFISYGGSALLATMAAAGLLLGISRWGRDKMRAERDQEVPPKRPRVGPNPRGRLSRLPNSGPA